MELSQLLQNFGANYRVVVGLLLVSEQLFKPDMSLALLSRWSILRLDR